MYRCDYCDGIVEAKCISIQFQRYRHTNHSKPVTIVKMIHFTPEQSSLPVSSATLSFVHHFKAIGEFKLELQTGNAQSGQNQWFFVPCDLEIWRMTLKNNRAPLLCCNISQPFANSNLSYSPEMPNFGQNHWFFGLCHTGRKISDLDLWPLTMTVCMNIASANIN